MLSSGAKSAEVPNSDVMILGHPWRTRLMTNNFGVPLHALPQKLELDKFLVINSSISAPLTTLPSSRS